MHVGIVNTERQGHLSLVFVLFAALCLCPGFGQDRVNFHQTPGRDRARRADPSWPNRAGYSIPCVSCWVPGGSVLFCVVFPLSVSLLLLFLLFAVLLNCPYPDPPVSACFFPLSSAPWRGEGRPRGTFVPCRSQTITA